MFSIPQNEIDLDCVDIDDHLKQNANSPLKLRNNSFVRNFSIDHDMGNFVKKPENDTTLSELPIFKTEVKEEEMDNYYKIYSHNKHQLNEVYSKLGAIGKNHELSLFNGNNQKKVSNMIREDQRDKKNESIRLKKYIFTSQSPSKKNIKSTSSSVLKYSNSIKDTFKTPERKENFLPQISNSVQALNGSNPRNSPEPIDTENKSTKKSSDDKIFYKNNLISKRQYVEILTNIRTSNNYDSAKYNDTRVIYKELLKHQPSNCSKNVKTEYYASIKAGTSHMNPQKAKMLNQEMGLLKKVIMLSSEYKINELKKQKTNTHLGEQTHDIDNIMRHSVETSRINHNNKSQYKEYSQTILNPFGQNEYQIAPLKTSKKALNQSQDHMSISQETKYLNKENGELVASLSLVRQQSPIIMSKMRYQDTNYSPRDHNSSFSKSILNPERSKSILAINHILEECEKAVQKDEECSELIEKNKIVLEKMDEIGEKCQIINSHHAEFSNLNVEDFAFLQYRQRNSREFKREDAQAIRDKIRETSAFIVKNRLHRKIPKARLFEININDIKFN